MKTITLLLLLILSFTALSQNTYDSLQNIPIQNIKSIYGHKAIILETSGFYTTPDEFGSLAGTRILNDTFTLQKVIKNKLNQYIVFSLGTDTIYYKVSQNSLDNPSFIIVEYFIKQGLINTGKSLKLRSEGDFIELKSGKFETFGPADNFICSGTAIIENKPCFILKNQYGKQIAVPFQGFETNSSQSVMQFNIN